MGKTLLLESVTTGTPHHKLMKNKKDNLTEAPVLVQICPKTPVFGQKHASFRPNLFQNTYIWIKTFGRLK